MSHSWNDLLLELSLQSGQVSVKSAKQGLYLSVSSCFRAHLLIIDETKNGKLEGLCLALLS